MVIAACSATVVHSQDAADSAPVDEKLQFAGDLRYRYEAFGAPNEFDRHRVRARFGVDAEVTKTTHAVFKLTTGAGDQRTAHMTFAGGYSHKEVAVDLAYLQWKPNEAVAVSAGKILYPTWRPSQSLFIGSTFNPEGFAANYANESGVFASGYSLWLDGDSLASDAKHNGAQLGYGFKNRRDDLKIALSYNDLSHVKGVLPSLHGTNAYGNSVNPDGSYAIDFRIVDASAQWIHETYAGSMTFFAHSAHNTAATQGADAYAVGVEFAPKVIARDWSGSYQYARIGQDSLFGQFMDGTFGGGVTDSRGHVFRVAHKPTARTRATFSYFDNDVDRAAQHHDFELIQIDIDFLF